MLQWPNVLAVDAALIAVAWQAALAAALGVSVHWPAQAVLALSVWLTYVADRLFDVAALPEASLLSLRHRFSKRQARRLWWCWGGALALNLLLATQLNTPQLQRGALLLLLCLLYTLLNQKLSRRFFPKELCVALIYAGGVTVLIRAAVPIDFIAGFTWLCLLNCLIIGAKEKSIDAALQVHSLAPFITQRWLGWLAIASAFALLLLAGALAWPLALCCGLLGALHALRAKIAVENLRVLADALLLLGPIVSLVF